MAAFGRRLVYLILAVFLTASCAGPETGKVVKRNYNPPWTEMHQSCIMFDKNGTCRSYMSTPIQHPESCELYLERGDEKGWRTIPCLEYGSYSVGDYYPKEK